MSDLPFAKYPSVARGIDILSQYDVVSITYRAENRAVRGSPIVQVLASPAPVIRPEISGWQRVDPGIGTMSPYWKISREALEQLEEDRRLDEPLSAEDRRRCLELAESIGFDDYYRDEMSELLALLRGKAK